MTIVGQEINYSQEMMEALGTMLQVEDLSREGRCSDCGQCCGNTLPMNFQEISRIEKYIKKHNIKPCRHFAPFNGSQASMVCPFRDNTAKRCTIYPVRPGICKTFFCGKPREQVVADRAAVYRRSTVEIDVRATFFGGKSAVAEYLRSQGGDVL